MQIAGGTKDISFGQLLDRIGVALGFPFPAGRYLDEIAIAHIDDDLSGSVGFPRVRIDDGYFNLSGPETKVLKYLEEQGLSASDPDPLIPTISEVFRHISDILIASAEYLSSKYGINKIYMAGGVASSATIRELIGNNSGLDIRFGDPVLSGDNAVGIARLAKRIYDN
jgi:N6-L-threonylcarbamoyladenine synthase